jgi:hypothetical protein
METSSAKSVIPVFLFFLLLLLGWFTYSIIGVTKGIATKSWTKTTAIVVTSEVKKGTSSKGSPKYSPEITYYYQIGAMEYTSKKYSSTTARGTSQWARQVVDKYPSGAEVAVYYNPKKVNESVLATGLQSDDYWMTILSGFFLAVVFLAFKKQLKNRKANKEDSDLIG